jgi:hypothetical protein
MTEVRTPPVRCTVVTRMAERYDANEAGFPAGAVEYGGDPVDRLWYACPCGCGMIGRLTIAENVKPAKVPSWKWTGGRENPTLEPSVHHIGHWHGHLQGGVWKSC